ncbi:hypothetical protein B0H17DRAFT_938179 [Mycena rosella]|uniref:MYND-type domain-containing protein n=1 Tax=Mycena rosella TaxID=1033263 RepID=A0AAD7GH24_MYCRO|nr:hypothetical protein B0H17DRAFT_938179 [Mycena rosella]
MKCARCGTTYYCSLAHQKSDWKRHKTACLAPAGPLSTVVKTRAEAERDGDTKFVIDAILLPWDSDTPRLVKLVCETYTDSEYGEDNLGFGSTQHRADLDPYLGPHHNTFYKSMDITTLGYTGRSLGYTLSLRWRDTFLVDGSKVNQSIVKLTNGKAYHPWAGNLIAYRVDEPTSMVARCKDAKPEDLAVLAAYFVDYGKRAKELDR